MNVYYKRLEKLRAHLAATEQHGWADRLLSAERSATTSGEALSNTGVVLKALLESHVADQLGLRREIQGIYDEGAAIWEGKK